MENIIGSQEQKEKNLMKELPIAHTHPDVYLFQMSFSLICRFIYETKITCILSVVIRL